MTGERQRADRLLVQRGLFESRARAQDAIRDGLVRADGRSVERPSELIPDDARIEARASHPFVSRGGIKLDAALDAFAFDPAGLHCLDVGASTGGFTDVLLRRGAHHVVALDVGRGQLHASLRADTRVSNLERTDIRSLDPETLPQPVGLIVVDVSFIALGAILGSIVTSMPCGGLFVALIKPQFEAGRAHVGRGGIVKDPAVHEVVCADISRRLIDLGLAVVGLIPSPIDGGDGNREFLIGARCD